MTILELDNEEVDVLKQALVACHRLCNDRANSERFDKTYRKNQFKMALKIHAIYEKLAEQGAELHND